MSKKCSWNKDEVNLLREKYPNSTKKELLILFPNKSINAIYRKASLLSLSKNINNIWTFEEIELLKNNFSTMDNDDLIKLFPTHTISGLRDKAYSLKLKKTPYWTEEELNILIDKYETSTKEYMLSLLPNKSIEIINGKAHCLGLKKTKETRSLQRKESCKLRSDIWQDWENELILKYYSETGTSLLIGLLPNRNEDTIRVQAKKIGINFIANDWSDEMINFLLNNYIYCSDIYELRDIFNNEFNLDKSYFSINSKLGSLGYCMTDIRHNISKNKDDIIELITNDFSDKDISNIYNCTENAISIFRQKLGIYKTTPWKTDEINILINAFPYMDISELCNLIPNRSWKMIKWKASQLGIQRNITIYTNDIYNKDLDTIWNRAKREEKCYQGNNWINYNRMSFDEVEFMYNYFDKKCPYCKEDYNDISFDHFIPMFKGGRLIKNNTMLCCLQCNSSKQHNNFEEWYINKQFNINFDKKEQLNKIYSYFELIKNENIDKVM